MITYSYFSHFIVNNILEGLIWFWVPASLVICNDVFAYIWGITLGRTPLIKLSPKKTVEGFIGAFWSTMIFGVFWGTYFIRFNYMICPVHDLGVSAWSSMQCTPNPVFAWKEWEIWTPVAIFLSTLVRIYSFLGVFWCLIVLPFISLVERLQPFLTHLINSIFYSCQFLPPLSRHSEGSSLLVSSAHSISRISDTAFLDMVA